MVAHKPGINRREAARESGVTFYQVVSGLDVCVVDNGELGVTAIRDGSDRYFRDLDAARTFAGAELSRLTPQMRVEDDGAIPVPRVIIESGRFEPRPPDVRPHEDWEVWDADGDVDESDIVEPDDAMLAEAARRADGSRR